MAGRAGRMRPPRPEPPLGGSDDPDLGPDLGPDSGPDPGPDSGPDPRAPDPRSVPMPQRRALAVRRAAQFGLDLAITAVLCLLPLSAMLALPRNPDGTLDNPLVAVPVLLLVLLACVLVAWCYWAVLPARRGGRTLGMRWLRLRVRALDGGEVSLAVMTLRWLFLAVDGLLLGVVGGAAILLTDRAQRLGDVVGGTVVVHERRRG